MVCKDIITEIFCSIDDFCLVFYPALQKRQVSTGKTTRNRKSTMSMGEILTIGNNGKAELINIDKSGANKHVI